MELQRLKNSFNWNIEHLASFDDFVWKFPSHTGDKIEYPEEGNNHCFELEEKSFWFKNRSAIICDFFKKYSHATSFWEIGAGNGFVSSCIRNLGIDVVTVEPGLLGAKHSAMRGNTSLSGFLHDLHLPDSAIPSVGCFDVLEHLDTPEEMIKEFYRILQPKGTLFVTVPAHAFLWSQTDDMSYHKKRYERAELIDLITRIGFSHLCCSYFFMSMVIPMYVLRSRPYKQGIRFDPDILEKNQKSQMTGGSSSIANPVINTILLLERLALKFCNLPSGTSLIGVFRK